MFMSIATTEQFTVLVSLIKEVKPGLGDTTIKIEDSLVEHLGLDSLDILQLSRKVNRRIGAFDIDQWSSGERTVRSILDAVNSPEPVSEPAST